ncbi:ribonuclease H-like protein [Imleria badia]|nr:ribonuclease H-like protein [Imleria badia]
MEPLTIYTDGSCLRNGKLDATCGSGIWFEDNDPKNKAIKVPGQHQSNQVGEIAAMIVALQQTNPTMPITIITDSRYVIDGLMKHLGTWEDRGWTGVSNAEWFQATAYQLRQRAAPANFKWVKGHAKTLGNERADMLANQGARKNHPDQIDCDVPENFRLQGVKLTTLTQQIAYQAIRERHNTPYMRSTLVNLDVTRYAVQDITHNLETDATLWRNQVGEFWANIPNYEMRAICSHCRDTTESLAHILTECDIGENAIVWELTKHVWPETARNWTTPTIGHILGCGSLTPDTTNEQGISSSRQRGITRLKCILLSESAYLIWTLRCDRVIGNHTSTHAAITTKWKNTITARLDIDHRLAKSNRKNYSKAKVLHTWSPLISNPTSLPQDWTRVCHGYG